MELLARLFGKKITDHDKDKLAEMLGTDPALLKRFEQAYANSCIDDVTAKTTAAEMKGDTPTELEPLCDRIVNELVGQTSTWSYSRDERGTTLVSMNGTDTLPDNEYLSAQDVNCIPAEIRPELTGRLMKRDVGECSYPMLLDYLMYMKQTTDTHEQQQHYYRFIQGLDTLDIDPVMYQMLSMNQNSMGYWLRRIIPSVENDGFFRIPATTIAKVPMTLLQLSRLDYASHNRTTLDIVNKWAQKVFELDPSKKYFIKTGTFSFKFDFRNAKITDPKEIMEIGEYLLYIQSHAVDMACFDPKTGRMPMVGVSTTNDWVVREFIEDENDEQFTIYHGLPLHTEYRAFIDFDTHEVLGIHPYWDPKTMKDRFDNGADCNDPDMIHDAITYRAQENILMARYHMHKDEIMSHLRHIAELTNSLTGQWSVDIMENGSTFWLIDMAQAQNSTFYEDTVPEEKRVPAEYNNWIPKLK